MQALFKIAVAASFMAFVSCHHSVGQNRIVISDPTGEGPEVIQIRPSNGQVYSIDPQAASASEAEPTEPSAPGNSESPTAAPPQDATNLASLPPVSRPRAPKHSYNRIETSRPVVAMTFDDGPHPQLTPKLLDLLKERNIRATFYVIGKNVEAYPEIARRIVEEGHEIGNHTFTHPALSKIGAARVKTEIDRTNTAIRQATGVMPRTMRPPYGATNVAINRRLREEFDLPVIMWSVDPQDWKHRNASRVSSHIINNSKAGDIILAHDIHPSTIAAMAPALDALLARGLKFVTVSELLEMEQAPKPDPLPTDMAATESAARTLE
jgi:peptidoglycan/xylan/chitin deacetylase (PgdA/CDA1 family)